MITDVPTSNDFRQAGIGFLNHAWDAAFSLVGLSTDFQDLDDSGEEVKEYWRSVQRPLATALALTQQGIELLLKAKISEVSPFLLLDSSWCRGHGQSDTPFSDLRTIDSQDLLSAHDTVHAKRLPDDFKNRISRLRKVRNAVFHTIDKRLQVTVNEVMYAILDSVHYLVAEMQWVSIRRVEIENSPLTAMQEDFHDAILAQEFAFIIDYFTPADVLRFLGVGKKERRYLCHKCHGSSLHLRDPLECRFAVLRPNTPASTNVYCFVCDAETKVLRTRCSSSDCKGNVIHEADDVCLTCWKGQQGRRRRVFVTA